MTPLEKAEVLTKYFGVYGRGNFDLSLEEIATIVDFICTKTHKDYLDVNLKEMYDRLSKQRLG